MIIATMIYLIRNGTAVDQISNEEMKLFREDSQEFFNSRYLSGDYRIILQLCSVLEHGKKAKRYADFAIDLCAHIQNLREAILNFKIKTEAPKNISPKDLEESKKLKELAEIGINYLIRYFYLIVFAEFLIQRVKNDPKGQAAPHEFSIWLARRREITNLVSKSLDFS